MITSTYLPIEEVLEYLLEYASFLQVEKLYPLHLANNTKRNYVAFLWINLTCMYLILSLWLIFFWHSCSFLSWQWYPCKPSSGSALSSGYVSDLSSLTISSLNVPFRFIPIIDGFLLFILLTILRRFLTQTGDTLFRVLKLLSIHGIKHCFENSFLEAYAKAVEVSLLFVAVLQISKLCISRNIFRSLLNSKLLSHWNNFDYLYTPPFLFIASNTNATTELYWSFIMRQYQHHVNLYLYVFFKDVMRYIKQIKLIQFSRFCFMI